MLFEKKVVSEEGRTGEDRRGKEGKMKGRTLSFISSTESFIFIFTILEIKEF